MINLEDLYDLLSELNIPVAYDHFNKAVEAPYIVYRVDHTENFFAENKTYKKNEIIYVELYTIKKDVALEVNLEALFDEYDIAWEIESQEYIDTEKVYQIIYRI